MHRKRIQVSNSRALPSLIVCALLAMGASPRPDVPLRELAADAVVVDVLKENNAQPLEPVAIKVLDQRWFVGKESVLARRTTKGSCGDRMRDFLKSNPTLSEAFVLDVQGRVVCSATRTMNYWYGEDPRWEKAIGGRDFRNKDGVISTPVMLEGKAIGVVTSKIAR